MRKEADYKEIKYRDCEECDHPGCRNHLTHPCEGCGRTRAEGIVFEDIRIPTRCFVDIKTNNNIDKKFVDKNDFLLEK
jgi:CRISPR/Cas system-associated protein Cas10 (large subunit of type III CRISPR-Cas system)